MKTQDLVAAFLTAGKARGLAAGTIDWYRIILERFARHCERLPRKSEPVEEFLSRCPANPRTRRDYWKALTAFCNWCEKRYGVTNPLQGMAPPRSSRALPRTLSPAELGCLFLVALSKRDRALVSLFLDTGIRAGEAVGLQPQDIGRESVMVDGKTGPREVPISPEVRSQLVDIAGRAYVFEGPKGHITPQHAYYLVRAAFEAAGIRGRKLGPHTLRHTFGRLFITAGGDAFSLQRILGHSNIQTTRIYVELNTQDIILQHHKFTPMRYVQGLAQGRLIDEPEYIIRTMKREEGKRD